MIKIHNTQTDEIIEREMNADELVVYEADKAQQIQEQITATNKAFEKAALLDRLGITAEEAKLLLS
jgi:hypothetical protein